jgi:hypothetical protein
MLSDCRGGQLDRQKGYTARGNPPRKQGERHVCYSPGCYQALLVAIPFLPFVKFDPP